MRLLILFSSILFSLLTTTGYAKQTGNCTASSPITFGILPFVSAQHLVIRFTPLVNYLSSHLNAQIRIETAPNFVEFTRRTAEDKRYDILFTAPHFYPQARKAGYRLIASVDSPGMKAVIVVPKNSSIKKLDDLRSKRLATVDTKSLATLLVKKHLLQHGIDASALMQPPYEAASVQVRNSMRIIAKTESAPHIPISVGDRISQPCAEEISTLLLTMSLSDEGRQVLKHNRFSGFRKPQADEYEKIKQLMLK